MHHLKYQRPTDEQFEVMKKLRYESKRAGLFKLEARARFTTK